jgi:hypothetical protein
MSPEEAESAFAFRQPLDSNDEVWWGAGHRLSTESKDGFGVNMDSGSDFK